MILKYWNIWVTLFTLSLQCDVYTFTSHANMRWLQLAIASRTSSHMLGCILIQSTLCVVFCSIPLRWSWKHKSTLTVCMKRTATTEQTNSMSENILWNPHLVIAQHMLHLNMITWYTARLSGEERNLYGTTRPFCEQKKRLQALAIYQWK